MGRPGCQWPRCGIVATHLQSRLAPSRPTLAQHPPGRWAAEPGWSWGAASAHAMPWRQRGRRSQKEGWPAPAWLVHSACDPSPLCVPLSARDAADIQFRGAGQRSAGGLHGLHRQLQHRGAAGELRRCEAAAAPPTERAVNAAPLPLAGGPQPPMGLSSSLIRGPQRRLHGRCRRSPPPLAAATHGRAAATPLQALEKGGQGTNAKFTYSCDGHSELACGWQQA